ncbi:MAG: hypothetical protein COW00_01860 [Bdellovibrio sp. CG12_big_fil_rev_8_21_14_0_65_39_13]|nr:MAG: hypothetical protein COW78_09710 [Bdellovibrio sp. CG22_combo_CG10-13_8_21_14_all_39_27]PIQ62345.1 MAG: hypothetical protein COW00_01860 [Bdellovibrio sp. CG12_big_fil_rev_8_21_14_0_65_39_13]PIR32379.1 MAG: hypothetical protein COV37_19950 [Bdellovibrio sp. CG11_big_fil_rev_8_21_14_0_20_39_38]
MTNQHISNVHETYHGQNISDEFQQKNEVSQRSNELINQTSNYRRQNKMNQSKNPTDKLSDKKPSQFYTVNHLFKNITCLLFMTVVMTNVVGCGRCDKNGGDSCQIQSETPNSTNNGGGNGPGDDSGSGGGGQDNGDGDDSRTITERLLESELITNSVYLGIVKPDDMLHFEIEGVEIVPQFSGIYERSYASSWKELFCPLVDFPVRDFPRPPFPPIPPIPPRPDFNKRGCRYVTVPGNCRHRFRDRVADRVQEIAINNDLENLKLKLVIGDKTFPLGEIVKREENKILAKLLLTQEMLTQEREAKLIIQRHDAYSVKVGFIGFGSCDGNGRRNFKTTGPIDSSNATVQTVQEFTVSASVEYVEGEE